MSKGVVDIAVTGEPRAAEGVMGVGGQSRIDPVEDGAGRTRRAKDLLMKMAVQAVDAIDLEGDVVPQ